MSDVTFLSGISGLSFESPFLSPLSLFRFFDLFVVVVLVVVVVVAFSA